MNNDNKPDQFEFIEDFVQNTKVQLTGEKLIGDIDFSFGRRIILYPPDPTVQTVFVVNTSLIATDTYGNLVEAETDLVMNIYKYGFPFNESELYGLFCCATIFNYHVITGKILQQGIMHDDAVYKPTKVVPSFRTVKKEIRQTIKDVYG